MRIESPDKHSRHLSLWLGLVGVIIVLGGGYFYFAHSQAAKTAPGQVGYLKPVPTDAQLRASVSDAQWKVMRENGTETAFQNQYWDNERAGIYVDAITGDPLFSSRDKFNANTGRPSFTKPISAGNIELKPDTSFGMQRTEVRAVKSNSHLGHLFKDGPPPTGERYAINSAALKFIPLENMVGQGYKDFVSFVEGSASTTPTPTPAAPAQGAK